MLPKLTKTTILKCDYFLPFYEKLLIFAILRAHSLFLSFMSFTALFLCLIALIITSSFFSISEISLAAAKKIRLRALSDEGHKKATRVLALQEHPGHFFTVIQICVNALSLAGGILGERLFTPNFTSLVSLFIHEPALAHNVGFWCGFITSTTLFILFADLIPKRLALVAPESIAMAVIGPMSFLIKILRPFVWFFNGLANVIIRRLGLPERTKDKITSEDIIATVDAGTAAGVIADEEKNAIENIFELESRTVPSSMTSRENIIYFLLSDSEEEICRKVVNSPHNQYIVCNENLDNVVGVIDSKALLGRIMSDHPLSLKDDGLVHPVQLVPDSLTLSEILDTFKRTNSDIAVIINEYALVVGIITLNDVMSTVMGDLVTTEEESQIVEREDGSWLVDGSTPVDDLERLLNVDSLPEDSTYETVAGFMMYMLRKIPKRTDKVVYGGYRFEVIDTDNNKVDQVLVSLIKPESVKNSPQDPLTATKTI